MEEEESTPAPAPTEPPNESEIPPERTTDEATASPLQAASPPPSDDGETIPLTMPPSDLSAVDEPPSQPKLVFPATNISGKLRSFSHKWYEEFKWLEYSSARNAVFCKMCRHFPEPHMENTFFRSGFVDWKHLRQACSKHQASKPHCIALGKFEGYRASLQGRGTVLDQLNPETMDRSFVERNRDHVKVVLDIVMFCAKQDLSLRGHKESEEALNKGIFLELFKFISKYDSEIQSRLQQMPKNAMLMSAKIQNELLESAASLLLRKIKAELRESPVTYYAILADEYKDMSKRELVAVCIRYIHAGTIKERAIGFVDTGDMSANAISEKILEVLQPLELDPSLCVGLSFDGASVMSGNRGGVHVILKRTFPDAVYVHCNSHRLNLVLCTASKVSGHVSTFFQTLNSLHSFMTGAHRHAKFLEIQKELHPNRQCLELERSTDTRWSSKSGSVSKVLVLLDVILETLAQFSETSGHTKVEAESLLQQIQTKKFLFLLVTFGKLFESSDFATKGLQSGSLTVTDCIDLIQGLKDSFAQFRDNSQGDFDKVLKLTEELMEKYDVSSWDVTGTRERKLPARFNESVVTTSLGKTTNVRNNADLKQLWINILDRQITELDSRFQQDQYGIMRAAAACFPGSVTFPQKESLQHSCDHYRISIEDAEWTVFIQTLRRKVERGHCYPSVIEVLDSCNSDVFPNINRLLRAMITIPMTSCTVERLFSTTGRIKTCLRSSMITARLNNLSLLSFERELTDSLDYDEIISIFNASPRRLHIVL